MTTTQEALAAAHKRAGLGRNDRDFLGRVWNTDLGHYRNRLRAIGLAGLNRVLDAGCGFGQWTYCLAELNRHVCGIDVSDTRVAAAGAIFEELGRMNVDLSVGSLEELPYQESSFDAIFCYSVIYQTDFRRTVKEFHRVLAPGGRLYLTSNGVGWYLYNIVSPHNPSEAFDPRQYAAESIAHSIDYFAGKTSGAESNGRSLITPSHVLQRTLEEAGFEGIRIDEDGGINFLPGLAVKSFYPRYFGEWENVFELLAEKPKAT